MTRSLSDKEQAIVAQADHTARKNVIDALVASVEYFTSPLADGGTICVMTLRSGYVVEGRSRCSDAEDGQALANTDALNKLWELQMFYEAQSKYEANVGGRA